MPGPPFVRGDRLSLHPVEREDLDFLRRHYNAPEVRVPLTIADPQNDHQAERRFERHAEDGGGIGLLVCEVDTDADTESDGDSDTEAATRPDDGPAGTGEDATPVGEIILFLIDETAGTAMLAYWIAPGAQGEGYATAATGLAMDHAFDERRLHKVSANVLASNAASRRVLEKVGFEHEGTMRDEDFIDGEYVDTDRYGLLAREWS